MDHAVKGQSIYAFVTLKDGSAHNEVMRKTLMAHVRQRIGAHAVPDVLHWAPGLPKTRSGKIMRRVLRKIAAGAWDLQTCLLLMRQASGMALACPWLPRQDLPPL